MPPIAISLSPNAERDDTLLALKTLLRPWRWYNQQQLTRARNDLERYFAGHEVVLTTSGRAALTATLTALGIGQGDEVIIQAFTCLAVPQSIKWSGATPVFADIETATFNLDPASVRTHLTSRTKAIVIQHTFGLPGPMTELQALAREHNLVLIEDCAHALGATYGDQPVGTLSDVAILSFGRDKCISSVFGGAVVSRNQQLINTIRASERQKPLPPRWWIAQQLLHPVAFSVIVPTYFQFKLGKVLLVILQHLKLLSKAVTAAERRGQQPNFTQWQYPPALAVLLSHQLMKLHRFTTHRRTLAKKYLKYLPSDSPLHQHLSSGAWLRFPWHVANPSVLLRTARRQRMLLGDWYHSPVTPCACTAETTNITGYQPGSCPTAEEASKHIINLPTYPKLTDEQAEKVVSFVQTNT